MIEPMAAVDDCEHHYETRILGGHPLHVRACYFCRKPDWDDLMEQAVELYRWGWQEGRAGKPPRDTLSAYEKPQEAPGPEDLVGAWAATPARYGTDGCTCQPFTARTDPPKFLQPGEAVDQTTSWQQDRGCPHHGEQAERGETPAASSWTQLEARAFNAILPTLRQAGEWLPLSARRAVANAVLDTVREHLDIGDAEAWCKTCRRVWDGPRHQCESDFDRDPAALAWARGKVQEAVNKAEECAANTSLSDQAREDWKQTAYFIRHELLAREGVVRAAFDQRWPDTLAAWDSGPTVREAAADDRRWFDVEREQP
ncbi:hypothetical protein TUSST3_08920 [Streptomyces sp. TUS-ST3]|uniref:hypothetical protein n=1 Tax=Streptomyces sp. TUS-ST3 TaxID=3025591 RepID=UPI0024E066B8|nr:hypothetical protein [Streptomyces sp. TUS-ST3]GLP64272.1 hypothetical protein TUSST3_08920 [Streptomyces sp. TUS-ST3]